jgi:hypothetical protein
MVTRLFQVHVRVPVDEKIDFVCIMPVIIAQLVLVIPLRIMTAQDFFIHWLKGIVILNIQSTKPLKKLSYDAINPVFSAMSIS